MSDALPIDTPLFDSGPPLRIQKALGLIRPPDARIGRRIVLALLIGWVPLAILSAVQGLALRENPWESFLLDWSAYARWFAAMPLLLLSESVCIPWLDAIARNFLHAGLVSDADLPRYQAIDMKTRRLLGSIWPEIVIAIVAYVSAVAWGTALPPTSASTWQTPVVDGRQALSLAGWWDVLVSRPLFLVLVYGWLWRLFVWGWFLWMMARLDLQLVPSHPDLLGGLAFVGISLRRFATLALALAAPVAGGIANRVVYGKAPLKSFEFVVAVLVALMLTLLAGPLLVFTRQLHRAKTHGLVEYGALAIGLGHHFEGKWIRPSPAPDAAALEAPDFSATTDLYSIAANVRQMKIFLADQQGLLVLVLWTLLPFVPVVLTVVPLKEALGTLAKLLLK